MPRVRFTIRRLMVAVAVLGVFLWAICYVLVRQRAHQALWGAVWYHRYSAGQCEVGAERTENVSVRSELLALAAWHRGRAEELGRLDPMAIPGGMLDRYRRESLARISRIVVNQPDPPPPD